MAVIPKPFLQCPLNADRTIVYCLAPSPTHSQLLLQNYTDLYLKTLIKIYIFKLKELYTMTKLWIFPILLQIRFIMYNIIPTIVLDFQIKITLWENPEKLLKSSFLHR